MVSVEQTQRALNYDLPHNSDSSIQGRVTSSSLGLAMNLCGDPESFRDLAKKVTDFMNKNTSPVDLTFEDKKGNLTKITLTPDNYNNGLTDTKAAMRGCCPTNFMAECISQRDMLGLPSEINKPDITKRKDVGGPSKPSIPSEFSKCRSFVNKYDGWWNTTFSQYSQEDVERAKKQCPLPK